MNNRYYKQVDPTTPLYLSNGQNLVFPTVDNEWGYIATKDKFLINEINTAINKGIGGVMVSTKEEYSDYLKKKSQGTIIQRKWREEIRGGYAMDSSVPPQQTESVQPAVSQESGEPAPEPAPAPKKRVGKFRKKSK
tara:strand:+ start:979 stop:1386 length:408 start_codon:yes stop_codon:yes gene_type:complete